MRNRINSVLWRPISAELKEKCFRVRKDLREHLVQSLCFMAPKRLKAPPERTEWVGYPGRIVVCSSPRAHSGVSVL